jgi:hypothetical protein
MIQKSFLNLKGDRFISKNPSNMARVGIIMQAFPEAKFIFIYRDPYKTVESFYRFFHEVLPAVQVQQTGNELSRKRVAQIYADMINRYFEERKLIPEENLIEIRFEDFKKDIPGNLAMIYTKLGIDGFDENRDKLSGYLESQKSYRQVKYDIDPETIRWVNEYAGDIVARLNYPRL